MSTSHNHFSLTHLYCSSTVISPKDMLVSSRMTVSIFLHSSPLFIASVAPEPQYRDALCRWAKKICKISNVDSKVKVRWTVLNTRMFCIVIDLHKKPIKMKKILGNYPLKAILTTFEIFCLPGKCQQSLQRIYSLKIYKETLNCYQECTPILDRPMKLAAIWLLCFPQQRHHIQTRQNRSIH